MNVYGEVTIKIIVDTDVEATQDNDLIAERFQEWAEEEYGLMFKDRVEIDTKIDMVR